MIARIISLATTCIVFAALAINTSQALEKIKIGTAIKLAPVYYLTITAAEEKGFFKEQGLEAEWVPLRSTVSLHHAITAGSLATGIEVGPSLIAGISRGVPAVLVAELQKYLSSGLYVRADHPARQPKDLKKGARVGVVSLGGTAHSYGRLLLRALEMEKDIRWVAAGGIPELFAALRTGAVDAATNTVHLMIPLEARGEIRALAKQEDYVKTELLGHVLWARKDYPGKSPQAVASMIKALLTSGQFMTNNQAWAVQKMMEMQGLTPAAARMMYSTFIFAKDGRISRQALSNTVNFLAEYGVIPKEKAPAPEEIYLSRFVESP